MTAQTVVFRGDDATEQQVKNRRRAVADFYANPYVLHWRGTTYIETRCPSDCTKRGTYDWRYCDHPIPTLREIAGPMSTDCADGPCWPCTLGIPSPLIAEPTADAPSLRRGPPSIGGGVTHGALRRIKRQQAAESLMDGRV